MAEEAEETQKQASGGKPWLLVLVAALASLLLGAGGSWFVLGRHSEAPPAAKSEVVKPPDPEPEADFADRVYALDPFVVNISGEGYPRYLKLKVAFEMDSAAGRQEIEQRVAQVRDTTILLLSSKRMADINDFEGKALLKDDLRDRVNALLKSGKVESVLFTEFVIQ